MVVGSMVAWLIAGAGVLMLALVFQALAVRKPDLDAGIFAYAEAGFGDYVGFNAATINRIVTVAKIIPIIVFAVLLAVFFDSRVFADNFWGRTRTFAGRGTAATMPSPSNPVWYSPTIGTR